MRSPFPRLVRVAPLALGAVVCSASASLAETQDEIVSQMQAEGYSSIEVSTTWLNRVRIVGEGMPGAREVVIDPRNGEVLRDFTDPTPPADMPNPPDHPPPPAGPGPGFPGGQDRAPPPGGPAGHDHPGGPAGHDHPDGPGGRGGGPGGPGGPGDGPGHSAPGGN
ncbi:hypothetical protein C8J30_10827 [Rhodobacter viridis]|uniref:YpeB-like protein with protease inhibitory function n=1 Tax=Rhodobacter viridis TaxID=1054202 RepID=A0A318TXP4_9RHOB|nr:hypothetical protein [Rhodobacter viridis]PYF09455.1 hypothetical protein C8J30_10827 [Rhodobacter viridis]